MAEIVELRIEKGVDELLELERVGLLSTSEMRTVIRKRKDMEYRLQRIRKCKQDYLKYISYEDSLLQLIRIRRKKMGFYHRYKEMERCIASRIAGIYSSLVKRYKSDVQLWLSYIEFCRKQRWSGTVSSLFTKMLNVHNKKEDIWILAARWESQFNNSMDTGRSLMQQALRFNPDSRALFREYFCLELNYADKIVRRGKIISQNSEAEADSNLEHEIADDAVSDAITSGAVAAVVFETALNRVPDPQFAIDLVSCLKPFDASFKDTLRLKLVQEVRSRFPDSEEVLQLLCERAVAAANQDNIFHVLVQGYEDAISTKPTQKMHTFYLKALLCLLSSVHSVHQKKEIVAKLNSVFMSTFEQEFLTVDMFSEWVLLNKALIMGSNRKRESLRKNLDDILIRVTNKMREAPKVWCIAVSVKIETSCGTDYDDIHRLFQRGLDRLSSFVATHGNVAQPDVDSIREYVHLYTKWAVGKISPKTVLSVLDSCSSGKIFTLSNACGRTLTAEFKTLLLTTACHMDSIGCAFRYYRKHKDCQPLTPLIFQTMIELSHDADPSLIAEVYEDYLNEFGSGNHHIWLDLVKFLMAKGEVTAIAEVHDRAVLKLEPEQQVHFISAYSQLMNDLC